MSLIPNNLIEVTEYSEGDISSIMPELQIIADGAPDTLIHNYFRSAVRDFANRSQIIQRNFCVNTIPCVANYGLDMGDEEIISFQHKVESNGYFRSNTSGINALFYAPHRELILDPIPSCESQVCFTVSVAPKVTSCTISQDIIDKYGDTLLHGAKYQLYAIPNQPWSNPVLMKFHKEQFDNGITAAGMDRLTNLGRGAFTFKTRRVI